MRSTTRAPMAALALFVANVAAQEAAKQPPLDLPAIIKLLDGDGVLPDVLDKWSRTKLDEAIELGSSITGAERDAIFADGIEHEIVVPLAVCVIAAGDSARATRSGLAVEALACFALGQQKLSWDLQRGLSEGRERLWHEIVSLAQRRGAVLTARFLREYPETPEVGHLLMAVPDEELGGHGPAIREFALRILGDDATVRERVQRVDDLFEAGDLRAVEHAIAGAERARPARTTDRREQDAATLTGVRRRLAAARALEDDVRGPGLAGRIARLRYLQCTSRSDAVAEARAMITEGVEHALPSTVLAAQCLSVGAGADEVAQHVERARALPGGDAQLAVLILTRRAKLGFTQAGSDAEQRRAAASMFETCDALVAGEASEPAILWRGLRSLGLAPDLHPKFLEDTKALAQLAGSLPDSSAAAMLLLAAAASANVAEGWDALERLSPTASRSVIGQRAAVAVRLALLADDDRHAGVVEDALKGLERSGRERDAHHLRGVLAWSRAARSGSADDRVTAYEHFTKAQRMAFERGALSAVMATYVAAVVTRSLPDQHELERVMAVALHSAGPTFLVPLAATWFELGASTDTAEDAEKLAGRLPSSGPTKRVLFGAMAQAHARRGDAKAAREAARQALAVEVAAHHEQLLERGILSIGEFTWNWAARVSGASLEVTMNLDLLPLPPDLPNRARLEELARE